MVSLYHRKLLDGFDLADVYTEIEEATRYISEETESMDVSVRDALLNRLRLRKTLLSAVQPDGILDHKRAWPWERCLEIIPTLSRTHKLGVSSEDSFSIKIQRKLASSVPPRPIVKISFDETLARLSAVCQNGKDAYQVLDSQSGTCLLVCNFWTLVCNRDLAELLLDVRHDIPLPKARTLRLCTMLTAVTGV